MAELKAPQDYEGQIHRLIHMHGLIVEDHDRARKILSQVNYYRLSAYGIGLKSADDPERYLPGISLDTLYQLYQFDRILRTLMIPVIETLEIELRTKIAYHLALTYGAEGYAEESHFIRKENKEGVSIHSSLMTRFQKEVVSHKNQPCVKHHLDKYEGHFPIWAAVELFSFGMLSSLYSIMQKQDRQAIAEQFHTDAKYLHGWILALVEVRNLCAHYGRIYNMPLKQKPYLYREFKQYSSNRIFPLLMTMRRMLSDKIVWLSFYESLVGLIEEHSEVKLQFIGFPENWAEILKP